jgi:HAMP domain-containing protein
MKRTIATLVLLLGSAALFVTTTVVAQKGRLSNVFNKASKGTLRDKFNFKSQRVGSGNGSYTNLRQRFNAKTVNATSGGKTGRAGSGDKTGATGRSLNRIKPTFETRIPKPKNNGPAR